MEGGWQFSLLLLLEERSNQLTLQGTEKHGSVVTSEQVVGLITGNLDETTGTGDRRKTKEAVV
jgi:hypothetical protein